MTQVDQFQVTLPSNSSIDLFPTNRPDRYSTKLAVPRELEGEWEVALIDIQYPLAWKTLHSDIQIGVVPCQYGKKKPQEDEFDKAVYDYLALDPNEPTCYARFTLPAGHYKSIQHVCEKLNKKLATAYADLGPKVGPSPSFQYDEDEDVVTGTRPVDAVTIFTDSIYLPRLLGLRLPQPRNRVIMFEHYKEFRSDQPPEFDTLKSMYIYSDIIKYQMVGDVQAPLLGILPVQGRYREQVFWHFTPPYYIPVSKNHIETIEIRLCTDTGEVFPILGNGKVISRLHFRRKHSIL